MKSNNLLKKRKASEDHHKEMQKGENGTVPKTSESNFGLSVLAKYRKVGFLKDASSSRLFWDFISCSSRVVRISIPKLEEQTQIPSNWIHLKLYRRVTDELSLHQILLLSANEVRKLLPQLPSILHDAEDYFFDKLDRASNAQDPVQEFTSRCPTEDEKIVDRMWDVSESPRRKVCVSCIYYDRSDYSRTYFNIRLYTRAAPIDNFDRKGVLSVRLSELQKINDESVKIMAEMIREKMKENAAKTECKTS